jgi:hypothetical protein
VAKRAQLRLATASIIQKFLEILGVGAARMDVQVGI